MLRRLRLAAFLVLLAGLATAGLRLSPLLTARAMALGEPAPTRQDAGVPVTFTVQDGMSPAAIATGLAGAGVLTDIRRFNLIVGLEGGGTDLRAGCYVFTKGTPASEIVRRLRGGITSVQLLPIPEGRRLEEVGALVERAGIADAAQWNAALAHASRDVLPEPLPPDRSLLGYLLPASYPLQCQGNADEMVAAMLRAFAQQVTPDTIAAIHAEDLTLDQAVILASIVEREAVQRSEQPIIASVFLNRLHKGLPLQADPTVQFALASMHPPKDGVAWWKTALTTQDLAVDSPYNTYLHPGLPPGPIANPGIDAIRAVAHPAQTDYLYFVAKGDGSHAFARTLEEHNANVARYQKP